MPRAFKRMFTLPETTAEGRQQEIDNLISSKEKIIEEVEQYKKSLRYEYVTGKKK